jgi:predicted nucleic acid-binding Zn ribbon protein
MLRKYRCLNCEHEWTLEVPTTGLLESRKYVKAPCPECFSRQTIRLITTAPAVIYKAKGFYKSDNRKKKSND